MSEHVLVGFRQNWSPKTCFLLQVVQKQPGGLVGGLTLSVCLHIVGTGAAVNLLTPSQKQQLMPVSTCPELNLTVSAAVSHVCIFRSNVTIFILTCCFPSSPFPTAVPRGAVV